MAPPWLKPGVRQANKMGSKSRKHFDDSAEDIDNLVGLHDAMVALSEADGEQVDEGLEVLFRSSVVLMVSHWEAYVEDIVAEAVEHLVKHVPEPQKLPKKIRQIVSKEIQQSHNELEMWQLAQDGWRTYLKTRLTKHQEDRNRNFNTPKAAATGEFISSVLGLADVTSKWSWVGVTSDEAKKRLDELVKVRGQIAHRGRVTQQLNKRFVEDHLALLRRLVSKTGGPINAHLKKVTGSGLF